MTLQYLLDNSGKTTAVVIPIADWEEITKKHADLKQLTSNSSKKRKPSEYAGCISKEKAEEIIKHIEQSRSEWDRDI